MIDKTIEIIKSLRPYEQISEDTELIESGILDSLAVITLITLLEDEFDVEIADDQVTAKNFATIQDIIRLLEKGI